MRELRDVRRGRARRPVALTTAVLIAAMLVPAGAAVADTDGAESTTSTEQVTVEPVVADQPVADQPTTDQPAEPVAVEAPATTTSTSSTAVTTQDASDTDTDSDTVVIIDDSDDSDAGGQDPVVIVPDDNAEESGGGSGSSGSEGSEELPTMDLSFGFNGLTWDEEWDESVATVGTTVHYVAHGSFPADASFDVDWYADNTWVGSGPSYTPKAADAGALLDIAWTVTAPNYEPHVGGQSVGFVVPGVQKMTGRIDVSGATGPSGSAVAYLGRPLVATANGEWPADAVFAYEWEISGQPRSDGATYTPWYGDLGHSVYLKVTVTAKGYETYHAGIPVASTIKDLPLMQQGEVKVDGRGDGEPVLGTTLTARASGWPADAVLTYEWTVNGEKRATTAAFTPAVQDLGGYVQVLVTATHPDFQPGYRHAWVGTVVTTPVVTVKSATVTAGDSAFLPVTVTGPKGGPVVTGPVQVTLVPKAGGPSVDLGTQQLDAGVAGFFLSDVPAGVYTVEARYESKPIEYARFASTVTTLAKAPEVSPYLSARGTGTLTVVAPKPVITAPTAITTAVATRASFSATVTLKGRALPETWTVREGTDVLVAGELGKGGTVEVTLPVLSVGTHTLVLEVPATARTAASSATITLTVTGEPARTGTTPTTGTVLETPKAATTPGQQMELVATGFVPGETVAFYLHSEPMFLGTAVAGLDGVARLLATVPAGAPTGTHTVIATGGTSGRWATLSVDLAVPAVTPVANPVAAAPAAPAAAPAAVPAATGDLAVTGSQTGPLMVGAWLLLGVGGGLVLVARRVRATR